MIYKKFIAATIVAAMAITTGCSSSESKNEIYVPEGETATNGDITIINGTKIDEPPTADEKTTVSIGLLKGASALSSAHLIENSAKGASYENYNYTVYDSEEDIINAMGNGEIKVASMPINAASKLYNRSSGKFKVAMINSLFNYCIAQNGVTLSNITDLAGKTVTVADDDPVGKAVINKVIADYEIQNCTVNTTESRNTLLNGLKDGSISLALTQEPFVSYAEAGNSAVSNGIDLYDYWFEKDNTDIVTSCIVVSDELVDYDKKTLVYFLKDYDASVTLTRKNPEESAALAEKYNLADSAGAAKSGIPGSGIVVDKGSSMRSKATECLNFISSVDAGAVGGTVPNDNFYFIESN